jgi:L,D-transpeptidase YbiS
MILINLHSQCLTFYLNGKLKFRYTISSSKLGVGQEKNSFKTPVGLHKIRAKIGNKLPINAIFSRRRYTGDVFLETINGRNKDWILSRILWLSGVQIGKNRLCSCDTMQRFIYIHGTPDSYVMGSPRSKGCIRMRNKDIIELFDNAPIYEAVVIY